MIFETVSQYCQKQIVNSKEIVKYLDDLIEHTPENTF